MDDKPRNGNFDDFDNRMLSFDFDQPTQDAPQVEQINTNASLDDTLVIAKKRGRKRQTEINLSEQVLDRLIPSLPDEDTDLFVITNGRGIPRQNATGEYEAFEFGQLVAYLVGLFPERGVTMYLSTWSLNRPHAELLLKLYDEGAVASISMLCDPSLRGRKSDIYATLVNGLRDRGQRYKGVNNHAKVLLLATPDEQTTLTVFGSANLSSLPRAENFVITRDAELYHRIKSEFFEAFFHGRTTRNARE